MATYLELFSLRHDTTLLKKITSAIAVKCKSIIDDGSSTNTQKTWARDLIQGPESKKDAIIWPVLVANMSSSVATIQGATDAQYQTNVDNAINDLIAGMV